MTNRLQRSAAGGLVGMLSAAVALGTGELVAVVVRPVAAPVIAVSNRFVLLTPEPVKRWAIRNFGTNDKTALLTGIYVFVTLFAIGIGILALRRLAYGIVGVLTFGLIGSYAALTSRAHHISDVLPTLFGTAAGVVAIVLLVRSLTANPTVGKPAAPAPPTPFVDRRLFLRNGLIAAGFAAAAGFGGRLAQHARFDVAAARAKIRLPTPARPLPGLPDGVELGRSGIAWQTSNSSFYRIDTAFSVPQINPDTWSLRIHGMVDREITLTYAELNALPLIERWITLCCVSNGIGGKLIGNARFLGARLADVLRKAGVHPDADQLLMTSSDGMTIGSPTAVVMDGRDALIAVGMNGVPLPVEHGFPARIVVPGLYGYVSACKWVVDIEATTYDAIDAYWAQGGWAAKTDIKLQSRIDTPRDGGALTAGTPVAVAGIAWDQHVGVSKIEVQVNDGDWLPAQLAAVPSTDTWRQWAIIWTPPKPGVYTLKVRATDAAGSVQTAKTADVFPSGATGLHTVSVRAH